MFFIIIVKHDYKYIMSTRVIDYVICFEENKLKIKKYHTRIYITIDVDLQCYN